MAFRRRLVVALAGAALLVPATDSLAATRTVDDDRAQCPRAPFTTIQEAVDAAGPRDVIDLCDGFYSESVTIGAGRNGLRVRPRRADRVAVDGGFSIDEGVFVRSIAGLIIDGDVFVGEGSFVRAIVGNDIRNGGITVAGGRVFSIWRNTISGYEHAGIAVRTTSASAPFTYARIDANRLVGEPGSVGVDIGQAACDPRKILVRMHDNFISGNRAPGGFGARASCAQVIMDTNRIFDNGTGVTLDGSRGLFYRNSIFANSGDGLIAEGVSGSAFARNDARSNGGIDCSDDSTGDGTAGTANRWVVNFGAESDPPGICGLR